VSAHSAQLVNGNESPWGVFFPSFYFQRVRAPYRQKLGRLHQIEVLNYFARASDGLISWRLMGL
jgi:hypothetical protein